MASGRQALITGTHAHGGVFGFPVVSRTSFKATQPARSKKKRNIETAVLSACDGTKKSKREVKHGFAQRVPGPLRGIQHAATGQVLPVKNQPNACPQLNASSQKPSA